MSGVNEATTCAQIVYALAHATQQKGKFTLIARLDGPSSQEHRFTPNERPFEFVRECSQREIRPEFELRKLDDRVTLEETGEDATDEAEVHQTRRLSANSSSTTVAELTDPNRSSSVDPNKNRPPPPDYNALMTERCNSLRRGSSHQMKKSTPLTFLNISNFSLQELYTHKFSRHDLETLADLQEKTLAAQKSELVRVELTLLDAKERELIQLRKQHNNLQTVLNSLRNTDWPSRLETEKAEAERLNTAIAAMRTAVAEKQRELQEALNLQQTLERQLTSEQKRANLENGIGEH